MESQKPCGYRLKDSKRLSKRKGEKYNMLWSTLFHKIGKQPIKDMQKHHVFAVLENPKTHRTEKVYLLLKSDAAGHPYFVQDFSRTEERNSGKKRGKR